MRALEVKECQHSFTFTSCFLVTSIVSIDISCVNQYRTRHHIKIKFRGKSFNEQN